MDSNHTIIKPAVSFQNLGRMDYQQAWDYQEALLRENVEIKTRIRELEDAGAPVPADLTTRDHLLFVEHPPVLTLGKSGHMENLLLTPELLEKKGIAFYKINRGGDITFHGPGQLVGYPILDLEHFYTDIGKYLRNIEEVIIQTLAEFGLKGERSAGETGVWLEPGRKGYERKICAIGVRTSRWITMHGFALNVNTDLHYFDFIVPCGITGKQVTSLKKELGREIDMNLLQQTVKTKFENVFDVEFRSEPNSTL